LAPHHRLKKIFLENWQAKLLSILLASGLWFYIASGESKIATFPNKIPLEVRNVPQGLVAISDVESVTIRVVADYPTWNKLSTSSFKAYVDVADRPTGTYELNVNAISLVSNVGISSAEPSKIFVTLENVAKKIVPVTVKLLGKPGEGLASLEPKITPDEVEIAGPASKVEKILNAVCKIMLEGDTVDVKKTVKLIAEDAAGAEIKNISFTPTEVEVTVPIGKAGKTKTVGIKVNTTGSLKTGWWLSKITVNPSSLTIGGSDQVLKDIDFIQTKPIDITDLSGEEKTFAFLDIPSGITILGDINKVEVNLYTSPISTSREMTVGYSWQNLSQSLKVASVSPSNVQVIVSGPADILQNLTASDISVLVNLQNYNSAGTYSIDLSKNNISTPPNVTGVNIMPSAISIQLAIK